MKGPRQDLEHIFRAGLLAAHGSGCVADYLEKNPIDRSICLVAIGKAASAMTAGALQVLGAQIHSGLLVTRNGHVDKAYLQDARFCCMQAGHPIPDARSLLAGEYLCRFLGEVPAEAELLFLISGGASSLVEVLSESTGLEQLQQLNQWLLGSGLDISIINRVRRSVSRIKGGGLISSLQERKTTVLLISDVAGDDPAIIGSGLLSSDSAPGVADLHLPDWIRAMINPADSPDAGICGHINHHVVASLDMALQAAAQAGAELGYPAKTFDERLAGEAACAGASLVAQLRDCRPGLYLWGGETVVTLPVVSGQGGRNQHLALAAACAMSDEDNLVLLSAGTDGSDGSTLAAGAIVDADTVSRCASGGFDAESCLDKADSGPCLAAAGDTFTTGPTGTNVTDMVIVIKQDETA